MNLDFQNTTVERATRICDLDFHLLVHRQHSPESWLPCQHMLHCLLRLLQREFLNHALDAMGLCKRNRVLRILSMA